MHSTSLPPRRDLFVPPRPVEFEGPWDAGAQAVVADAISAFESDVAASTLKTPLSPWVCLCTDVGPTRRYFAQRARYRRVFSAQSPRQLAEMIGAVDPSAPEAWSLPPSCG